MPFLPYAPTTFTFPYDCMKQFETWLIRAQSEPWSLEQDRPIVILLFEMKICSWLYSSPVLWPSRPCSRPSFEKYQKPSLQRTLCSSLHPKHFQIEKVYQKHSWIGDQHQLFTLEFKCTQWPLNLGIVYHKRSNNMAPIPYISKNRATYSQHEQ